MNRIPSWTRWLAGPLLVLAAIVVLMPGCGSGDPAPSDDSPTFNSIDESLTCPAGQIGWDFGTGGTSVSTAAGTALSGIQVIDATWGGNCSNGGALFGNQTHDVTAKCNGEYLCDFTAGLQYDASVNCPKNFEAHWRCGAESTVYSTLITGEASGKRATLDCGPRIKVITATYAARTPSADAKLHGCQVPLGANTNQWKAKCDDTRKCNVTLVDDVPKYAVDLCKSLIVRWQCGNSPALYSIDRDNVQYGETVTLGCEAAPIMHIVDATYGANCGATSADWLAKDRAKTSCDLKTSCTLPIKDLGDPAFGCRKAFTVRYTCGESPVEYTTTVPGEAGGQTMNLSCVGAGSFKPARLPGAVTVKKCVPKTCTGLQKRGPNMECVNTSKPYITNATIAGVRVLDAKGSEITAAFANSGSGPEFFASTPLLANTPYRIAMDLDMSAPQPAHPRVVPWLTSAFSTADFRDTEYGFVCSLTPIDFNHTAPIRVTARDSSLPTYQIIPPSCFDVRSNAVADAAKRRGMTETEFRAKFPNALGTIMRYSLDPDDQYTWLRGVYEIPNAPNPPGFFYNKARDWTDLVAYYQQREIDTLKATLPSSRNKFHFQPPKDIGVAISDWKVVDGATKNIEYFPGAPVTGNLDINYAMTGDWPLNPLSPSANTAVANLRSRHLRATVEVFPYNDEAHPIVVASVPLLDGNPTGAVRTTSFSWDLLHDKIFGDWGGVSSLDMKVCIDVDGTNTRTGGTSIVQGANGYTASIDGNCRKKSNALIFTRSITRRPLPPDSPTANVANSKSNTSGNSKTSGTNNSALDKSCTESGAGATLVQNCTTTRTSSMTASGELGKTYYYSQSGTQRTETGSSVSASASMKTEVLGFQVVDVGDQDNDMMWGKAGSVFNASAPVRISIAPNWDLVIAAVKSAAPETDPKKGFYGGRAGLGVGIGYKQPFFIGVIDISATVGVSVSLDFSLRFQPETPYPCINNTGQKCFAVLPTAQTQNDARIACLAKGGRLAQMVTGTDRAGIQNVAGTAQNYWTGGQLVYTYPNVSCAKDPSTTTCKNGSTTTYRWIGNDSTFGSSPGLSNAITLNGNTTATAAENGLSTRVPIDSGIMINGTSKVLTSAVQSTRALGICEFDGANSTTYQQWDVGLRFGAGAGVGIGFCTPTPEIGVCIAGQLNLVDVSVTPTIGQTAFTLRRYDGTRFGTRGNTFVDVPWSISLLTGQVVLTANFLFTSTSWTLAEFEGFKVAGGSLYRSDSPTREDF